jgi:hypothetical protein
MNLPRKEPAAEAERTLRRGGWFGATVILGYLASLKLLVHLLTNGNYGYFRDELYYVAAGERLALGYVDFPPFVALVTAFTRILLATLRWLYVSCPPWPARWWWSSRD